MRNLLLIIFISVVFLIIEATILSFIFSFAFKILGFASISYIRPDTAFLLCICVAMRRNLRESLMAAFLIGFIKDTFVLSDAFFSPFIFVLTVFVTSIMRSILLLKGKFSFCGYVFVASFFYCFLFALLSKNINGTSGTYLLALIISFPVAISNAVFAPVVYSVVKRFHFKEVHEEFRKA